MSDVLLVTEDGGLSVRGLPDTPSARNRLASHLDGLRLATDEEVAASRADYDAQLKAAGLPVRSA